MSLKPCIEPGCRNLSDQTRCALHRKAKAARRKAQGFTGSRGSTRQWRMLRARIIARDGHVCQTCGTSRFLEVHHIDGNAFNNVEDNLTTMCRTCHQQTFKG